MNSIASDPRFLDQCNSGSQFDLGGGRPWMDLGLAARRSAATNGTASNSGGLGGYTQGVSTMASCAIRPRALTGPEHCSTHNARQAGLAADVVIGRGEQNQSGDSSGPALSCGVRCAGGRWSIELALDI